MGLSSGKGPLKQLFEMTVVLQGGVRDQMSDCGIHCAQWKKPIELINHLAALRV
jgi:hypothetical protein